MNVTPLIALLDLLAAGVRITSAMQEVFRNADAEGRNVTLEELQIASDKSDAAHDALKAAFGG